MKTTQKTFHLSTRWTSKEQNFLSTQLQRDANVCTKQLIVCLKTLWLSWFESDSSRKIGKQELYVWVFNTSYFQFSLPKRGKRFNIDSLWVMMIRWEIFHLFEKWACIMCPIYAYLDVRKQHKIRKISKSSCFGTKMNCCSFLFAFVWTA